MGDVTPYPRSTTRMKAHTDPSWASDRIIELEAEVERLREALELIARDYWTRDRGAQMLQETARKALTR